MNIFDNFCVFQSDSGWLTVLLQIKLNLTLVRDF